MLHEKPVPEDAVPLFVDVDGTLIRADISLESFLRFIRSSALAWFMLLAWLVRGRAAAKTMVARRFPVDPATLPYRPETLDLVEKARAEGRPVILASASHWRNIRRIAHHLGVADSVIATSARANLKGPAKLGAIRDIVGVGAGFDYVGDCRADVCLWREARQGWSVGHLPGGSSV